MISVISSFEEKDNVDGFGPLTESLKSEFSMIFEKLYDDRRSPQSAA